MSNKIPEETLKQWREEFDINLFNGASFRRESSEASFIRDSEAYRLKLNGYLSARKKAQEKINERDELIKEAMPYIEYLSKGRLYNNHLVDAWIEKAEKIKAQLSAQEYLWH